MDLRRPDFPATQSHLTQQAGFAYVFLLALLPVLLSGILVILFSQFLVQNWMQSLHICRGELLSAQSKVARSLETLMRLNPLAEALRSRLQVLRIQQAAALASENYPLAAKLGVEISKIERQRQQLGSKQKALISTANLDMRNGAAQAARKIQRQSKLLQSHLPDFFSFRIKNLSVISHTLAVHPDRPDVAPVYELKSPFQESQSLHVSWIAEFSTRSPEKSKWIQQRHRKWDGCSASLLAEGLQFQEILIEDKSFLKF